jgi:protein SCO1/2
LAVVFAFVVLVLGYSLYTAGNKAIDFRLVNWDQETVTMSDLRGNTVVLAFSYSNCSIRCPVVTVRLALLDELLNSPEDLVYLHVSIDPEKDTPESMKKYFGLYKLDPARDKRWMFVSGEVNELSVLWKYYGIEVEKVEEKRLPEGYYMEYTPKLVLIDKKGVIRHEENLFFDDEDIVKKIRKIT